MVRRETTGRYEPSTSAPDLQAVTAALVGVQPRPSRVVLFGSRARGQARPDSDIDRLVVMPQPTLTANERTSTSC